MYLKDESLKVMNDRKYTEISGKIVNDQGIREMVRNLCFLLESFTETQIVVQYSFKNSILTFYVLCLNMKSKANNRFPDRKKHREIFGFTAFFKKPSLYFFQH